MIYIVNLGDTMAPRGLWRDPPLTLVPLYC